MWEMHPTKQQGATMGKFTAEIVSEIVGNMIAVYGGREVHNAELKRWLCATYPTLFPSGRADGFIEQIAMVDYASTISRKKGVSGYAFLKGIKRERARLWLVPSTMPAELLPKGSLESLQAPLPTKKRVSIRFGEYIAAKKGQGE